MKKMRFIRSGIIAVLGVGIIALTAQADIWDKPSGAARGIKASKHNLSNWSLYKIRVQGDTTQVCIFCHAPHNADSTQAPLWNRQESTASVFDISSSRFVKPGNNPLPEVEIDTTPTGITKKCLSCHDGTISVGATINGGPITMSGDNIDLASGQLKNTAAGYISPTNSAGNSLNKGHIVSFVYDNTLKDWLNQPAQYGAGAFVNTTDKSMLDRTNRMHCHTCHDPHTDWCDDSSKRVGSDPLWRKACGVAGVGNGSVCEHCHSGSFDYYTSPKYPF